MKGQTIRDLAVELDVEVDDVLLALWECGLVQFTTGSDLVFSRESALSVRPSASQSPVK